MRSLRLYRLVPLVLLAGWALGCRRSEAGSGDLVIAATGEPATVVPPLIGEAVGRDIADLVYQRLAVLRPGGSPADTAAFRPDLATEWTRIDSLSWRFTLGSARWHDGVPVTADDVVFSFAAFVDTALGAPAGPALGGVRVTAEGADRVVVTFPRPAAEQLYDAATAVRIMPRHLWDSIPRDRWGGDTSLALLVGSGRYRIAEWRRGQSLVAERVGGDGFRRIVWRFAGDQDAALNLVLSGEADVVETVTSPAARERAAGDSAVTSLPYPSAVSGFLGFRVADSAGRPDPVLGDRRVRQALALAVDRETLIHAVIGPDAVVPPGPISRALWIWDEGIARLPFDTARAAGLLDQAGFRTGPGGLRRRGGRPLTIDILVPSTSGTRRQLAEGIQQMWRAVGVGATITAVDFPVFQERLGRGRFDAMIGAWLDEPSPRSLADQWTTGGIGILNHGRYSSRVFDSLVALAIGAPSAEQARPLWRAALDTLNAEAPAIFLYTPTNVAVTSRRLAGVTIDPFSWLHTVATWTKRP